MSKLIRQCGFVENLEYIYGKVMLERKALRRNPTSVNKAFSEFRIVHLILYT